MAHHHHPLGLFGIALLLLSLFDICNGQVTDFNVCGGERSFAESNRNHQHGLAHNPVNDEYLLAWINEDLIGQTDVLAQRLTADGIPVGPVITVLSHTEEPLTKKYAVVSHSHTTNVYIVAFEVLVDDGETDTIGRLISFNGTPGAFLLVASYAGRDDSPHIAYNTARDKWAIVFEHEDPEISGGSNIFIFHLYPNGTADENGLALVIQARETEPNIAFNPVFDEYLIVFETDAFGDSDVAAFRVDDNLNPLSNAFVVGSLTYDGEFIHDHRPQIIHNPENYGYALVWEVDVFGNGNEPGQTDIATALLDDFGGRASPTALFGGLTVQERDRNPAVAIAPRTNDVVIAFETNNVGSPTSNIIGVVYSGKNITTPVNVFTLNQESLREFRPAIAYNSLRGDFLVIWDQVNATVTPPPTLTTETTSDTTSAATTSAATTSEQASTSVEQTSSAEESTTFSSEEPTTSSSEEPTSSSSEDPSSSVDETTSSSQDETAATVEAKRGDENLSTAWSDFLDVYDSQKEAFKARLRSTPVTRLPSITERNSIDRKDTVAPLSRSIEPVTRVAARQSAANFDDLKGVILCGSSSGTIATSETTATSATTATATSSTTRPDTGGQINSDSISSSGGNAGLVLGILIPILLIVLIAVIAAVVYFRFYKKKRDEKTYKLSRMEQELEEKGRERE